MTNHALDLDFDYPQSWEMYRPHSEELHLESSVGPPEGGSRTLRVVRPDGEWGVLVEFRASTSPLESGGEWLICSQKRNEVIQGKGRYQDSERTVGYAGTGESTTEVETAQNRQEARQKAEQAVSSLQR